MLMKWAFMKISHKLIVLVTIPLLAFFILSMMFINVNIKESKIVDDMAGNTKLMIAISDLIHELQIERGRTSVFLSGGSQDEMNIQRKSSDLKIQPLLNALKSAAVDNQIRNIMSESTSGIEKIRSIANKKSSAKEVVDAYGALIAQLMTSETYIANSKTTRGFGKALTSLIILETAKENAGKLRATVSGILTADKPIDDELFTRLITFKANIDANLDSKAMVLGPVAKSLLDESRKSESWTRVNQGFNTVLSKSKEGNYGINGKDFFATITKTIDDMYLVRNKEVESAVGNLHTIQEEISNTLLKVYLSVGFALLLALSSAIYLARSITSPINHLIAYAKSVAGGDLNTKIVEKFSHELGSLKDSLASMIQNLKSKIQEAEENSAKAAEQSEKAFLAMQAAEEARQGAENAKAEGMIAAANHIEGVVEILTSASEELSAQIEQSSRGADEQSGRVRETATAMEEMNATVLEVAKNAQQAADISNQARQQAQEGSKIVTDAVKSIEAVHAQSIAIKEDMDVLGKQAEGIGQIMGVIADIADQTNLLALNAAIEAARAGDAGRGFAVVADEVRKLAEKTMTATQEVGQAITGIQQGTRKNIQNVEQAGVSIEEAAKLSAQSGESLKHILEFVHMVNDQVQSIATASEQQSAVSEEINRSVEQVATISAETAQAMDQAFSAVAELAQQSHTLQRLIVEMKNG